MARGSEENTGLPSFFQDNSWLDILAQRGVGPAPDFVASGASSAPAVGWAMPVFEPEPIASSPTTTPTATPAGFPRELVVRLEMPSELLEAIKELKEAIIMALSVSQRQATIVPVYIPICVAQMAPQVLPQASHAPTETSGETICPKCGRPGRLYEHRKGRRTYIYMLHGGSKCYLGPTDRVKVMQPSLAERALLNNAQQHQAGILSLQAPWPSKPQVPGSSPGGPARRRGLSPPCPPFGSFPSISSSGLWLIARQRASTHIALMFMSLTRRASANSRSILNFILFHS